MKSIKEMEKLRNKFMDVADCIDELINICKREESGEDVEEEYYSAMGKFTITAMELHELSTR